MKPLILRIHLPRFDLKLKHIVCFSVILSVISAIIAYKYDVMLAYNDARAHMNMARLVFDNLKPGLAQLGGVWLPLNHVLMFPLIWNNWMWHTGMAGTIYSMVFFILSNVIVFKLLSASIKDKSSVFIGFFSFVTNLNILYMQSTPMTELPLIFFFISSTYFLYKWIENHNLIDLLLASISVFLAVMTRYDGWFLFIALFSVLIYEGVLNIKEILKNNYREFNKYASQLFNKSKGIIILFTTLSGFGIALWLLWNILIFKNPLYFILGPYSAHAQQQNIEAAGKLFTKYNIFLSAKAYWWAMSDNVGFLILIVAIIGLIIYFQKYKFDKKSIVIYSLLTPFLFHFISLFAGNSVLMVPELNIDAGNGLKGSLFNARYGLMILPAVSFFLAYLSSRDTLLKIVVVFLIILQPLMFFNENYIITLLDAQMGSSSLDVSDISNWMKENVKNDKELILLSMSFNSSLAFTTGFDLKQFIHEGTGKYWETSIVQPDIYADWIVIPKADVGDPIYTSLVKNGGSKFLRNFELAKEFKDLYVYKKKSYPDNFIYVKNGLFTVNDNKYDFIGVNSYDLIFRPPNEVASTLSSAKDNGFNVVRFWVFGEGDKNLIQPKPGEYNELLLDNLDFVLATAKKLDMKVIITLSNYWKDYGGVRQYLKWVDLPYEKSSDLDRFFSDERSITLYKNYIKIIIERKNTINQENYKDDPTILSWELMNEPRSSSIKTSNMVIEWINEMSNYIRSLDNYHIVTTGHEGYFDDLRINPYNTGPSINQINNLNSIDVLTGHYYMGNYRSDKTNVEFEILNLWGGYANKAIKAFFVEEIGFSKKQEENEGADRYDLYNNLLKSAKRNDLQGIILWNWALKIDDTTGISPLDPKDKELLKLFKSYSESLKNDV